MPAHRSSRRTSCTMPKYTFSDDEEDDGPSQTNMQTSMSNAFTVPSILVEPPARSSHTRKRPSSHVRRPRNAFIIFRSDFCDRQKMKESGIESDHRHISRIAAHVWNNLSDDQKKVYQARAEAEKAEHKIAYPDYRYIPSSRSKPDVKRKTKRDNNGDQLRCRQLAELLLSGVEGKELQQAAKDLDEGIAEIKVTHRTSRPAPKRYRRGTCSTPRLPAVKREQSVEKKVKKESLSPGRDLGLPSSFPSSSSSDTLSLESEQDTWEDANTSGLSSAREWKSELDQDFNSSFRLSSYYQPVDNYPTVPTLSDDIKVEHTPHPHMRPSASSNLTLAQLSVQRSPPPTPNTLQNPQPLPGDDLSANSYQDAADASWPTPVFDMPGFPALSATTSALPSCPSASDKYKNNFERRSERSLSPVLLSQAAPWKMDADEELLLAQAAEDLSLCYPDDDIDFEDCIAVT